MIRLCCYCNAIMGHKEPLEDTTITHGICHNCMDKELRKIACLTGQPYEELKKEYLDSLAQKMQHNGE